VRLVKDNTHCTPHQVTIGQPQLEVDALMALPKPDEAQKPQEEKNKADDAKQADEEKPAEPK
jgi:hypothetical protein